MKVFGKIQDAIWPSNMIIREYIEKIEKGNTLQENTSEFRWMREDLLKSDLYSCTLNGNKISLNEVLFENGCAGIGQNIIIIIGEKHIGKKSFARKLLSVCKESTQEKKGNIVDLFSRNAYRIPVLINYEWYKKKGRNLKLEELIVESIVEQVSSAVAVGHNYSTLKTDVEKLLAAGRFLIYFEGKLWLKELEDELEKILCYGKIVKSYYQKAKYRNLVVLTVDSEADIKNSFLNENMYLTIQLNKLTRKEVELYIERYLPALKSIIDENEIIMEMLQYPEHLKMVESLYEQELLLDKDKKNLYSDFAFYEFFIRAHIKKGLDTEASNRHRENAIFIGLRDYAVEFYINKNRKERDPSHYFSFSKFYDLGLIEADTGEFRFPYCGYYLVSKYLYDQLEKGGLHTIPSNLLEEPLEIILLWLSRMISNITLFNTFWEVLCENESCKLLLLAKIVKESRFKDSYLENLYEKAFTNLQKDFYDYTVLEALKELGDDGATFLKKQYLSIERDNNYDDIQKNNIKKRSVYFLGISHSGIIEKMLSELMETGVDLHLKYHIIRALVENYGLDNESTRIIDQGFGKLTEYCAVLEDPIIRSDFCILYEKYKKEEWMSKSESYNLYTELKDRMKDKVYWIRAHAAGAIGRQNMPNAFELLLDRVKEELRMIYARRNDYRNSIKVISYSIEAICELSDYRGAEKENIIQRLVKLIDMGKLGDEDVEDAYSTIATGIEYMINVDKGKLPFNLGGRFRNHSIDYRRVLLHVFRQLEILFEDHVEIFELIRNNIEILESYAEKKSERKPAINSLSQVRILQLTDWHFSGENADNNMLIQKIKSDIKDIDILVLTGDLKEFTGDYDKTLEILNEITNSLKLKPKDVFMVPGNHDSEWFKGKEEIVNAIKKGIYDDKEIYLKYENELYKSFQSYEEFLKKFYGEDLVNHGGVHNELIQWEDSLQILCMNTALICDGNENKQITNLTELSRLKKEDKPVICLAHHKFDDIMLEISDMIKTIFSDLDVSLLLSGDIHRSGVDPIDINGNIINNYYCGKFLGKTGDTWSTRNVAIYTINLEQKKIFPKLFEWKNGKLEPSNDFKYQEKSSMVEDEWKDRIEELL